MKRKIFIYIALFTLILAGILTTALLIKGRNKDIPEIVITYPKDIQNLDTLGNILLDDFSSKKNIPHSLKVSDSNYYLDELQDKLKEESHGDIYYVVNNRFINSPGITNSAYNYDISDRTFKKIPMSFKSLTKVNNTFTYVPLTWAPWGIYYNKKVFSNIGLKEPEDFDQLEEICNRLLAEDKVPFSMIQNLKWPLTSWFDYISIRNYGAGFHNNLLSGRIDFRSEEVKKIFFTLKDLIDKGWLYSTDSGEWTVMTETLIAEKTVMALSSTFFYTNIPESERENIGWFPFPEINEKYNDEIITSSGFIASEMIENVSEVEEFYKYILTDGQKIVDEYTMFNSIDKRIIQSTEREDLIEGYNNAESSSSIIPSFERNNHPRLTSPLKYSINKLFQIEDEDEILTLLEDMEEIRTQI